MEQNERRFAILIDADNASPKHIKYILDEVSDVGIVTYKRIYSDWIGNEKHSWRNVLLDWSVSPIQQYSYTVGKNITDSVMIIDAMNILYFGNVDGFCLVPSDSDSTRLVQRLRETGMLVVGIREQKTPKPFRTACGIFKLLEIVSSDNTPETSIIESQRTITDIDEIQKAIAKLLIESNSQNQPIILTRVGNFLTKHFSDFSVRSYGYSRLPTFLESLNSNDFQVIRLYGDYFAQERNASISKTEIGEEIIHIIKGYNGHVDNLSIVHDGLKRIYPSFDVEQYGFSRIFSFIRSSRTLRIKNSMVQLR